MNTLAFEVLLPLAMRHPLTYQIPEELRGQVRPGQRVLVPLGRKSVVGCLLRAVPPPARIKLKPIEKILDDTPILTPKDLKLLEWASAYYLTPIGEVLRHFLPPEIFSQKKTNPKPRKVLPVSGDFSRNDTVELTPHQKKAVSDVLASLASRKPVLLQGVTGSGKTEVYLEAVRHLLRDGGQALLLVPEIGLTPQQIGRFASLGKSSVVYHSGLTPAQRLSTWQDIRLGKFSLVVATRSGIFLPFPDLRLIVIDEEHDASYKQEERFCYHARDLALWKARESGLPVILGTATPSLETQENVTREKIACVRLTERPPGVSFPKTVLIDRRREKDGHAIFSPLLLEEMRKTLNRREQVMLFLNRRGIAPFVLCALCGHVPTCDQCDISLTLHREPKGYYLLCHYCDQRRPHVALCPQCREGSLTQRGFGTEKVAQEVAKLFALARTARLDRDSTAGGEWLTTLEKMRRGEIDILIGTQMITKGHDYPHLTLVGILDADVGLHLPDFRASERMFQTLTQVSGRAGRAQKPGQVLIQTFRPDHKSLTAAMSQNARDFYEQEQSSRREAHYPPHCRIVEVRFSGINASLVRQAISGLAKKLAKIIVSPEALLGPSPCAIEKVRNRYRWHLLIKTAAYAKLQPKLLALLDAFAENDLPSSVKMLVNVDPVDLM